MKTIGISDFKGLVNARLDDPNAYVGKTLVLWNAAYMNYGIAYRVIEECCVEHNNAKTNHQVWFKYSDMTFLTDDNTNIHGFCERSEMYGYKDQGILFNTGCFRLTMKEQWLNFINTNKNNKGGISSNWPLVACAQVKGTDIVENDFAENCEICKLQPTVEEWRRWTSTSENEELIRLIIEYNGGNILDFDYWERAVWALGYLLDEHGSIYQIPQKEFALDLKGSIADFPVEEFWNFIHSK